MHSADPAHEQKAIPVAVRREFWTAIQFGMVVAEAAAPIGVSITVAWEWFGTLAA